MKLRYFQQLLIRDFVSSDRTGQLFVRTGLLSPANPVEQHTPTCDSTGFTPVIDAIVRGVPRNDLFVRQVVVIELGGLYSSQ